LDQLPVEPLDLRLSQLKRSPSLHQRGTLLVELGLRLLPCRALMLECGLSILKCDSLLLVLCLHLCTRATLLLGSVLDPSERCDLLLQGSTQFLDPLRLLLSLGLPGPRPLEGRAVL
jgi:hypothetical protein